MDKRANALARAEELKNGIKNFVAAKEMIPCGRDELFRKTQQKNKSRLLKLLNADEEDWANYKWQLGNRVSTLDVLQKMVSLQQEDILTLRKVSEKFRWSISPYYLSLVGGVNGLDPIWLQCIPTALELNGEGIPDPMAEEFTNPAGAITRRYPDRLIINVTNKCATYCRHCQRRRNIGSHDLHTSKDEMLESIQYIKSNPEIRDVLVTGGDALLLSDDDLEWLLTELYTIPSVEIVRIGTRTPITLPQRITDSLMGVLKKFSPLYINTQFNHPLEITEDAKMACDKLAEAGIPLGNQAVLLNGINNNKYVMRVLNQELLKIRVKPYYIFHAKNVVGTTHFNTSVDDGIEIMEYLRGYTSGMAIPAYIINAPGGNGKTPILPQYVLSRGKETVKIRTWEGKIFDYPNPPTRDIGALLGINLLG